MFATLFTEVVAIVLVWVFPVIALNKFEKKPTMLSQMLCVVIELDTEEWRPDAAIPVATVTNATSANSVKALSILSLVIYNRGSAFIKQSMPQYFARACSSSSPR